MRTLAPAFLFFLLVSEAFAFVNAKNDSGDDTKWSSGRNGIRIDISLENATRKSLNVSKSSLKNIINNSIAEWESVVPIDISYAYTDSLSPIGRGTTIRFVTNEAYFGSGVLAVTSASFSASSGDMTSADILINESDANTVLFTDDATLSSGSYAYYGDIITHELGHFFGLSHSEVVGASMNYVVAKGHHSISSDEIKGIATQYDKESSSQSIRGRVIGANQIAIFGATVQLISVEGEVIASQITTESGYFKFHHLDQGHYIITVAPIKNVSALPTFYQTVQNNFCPGEYQLSVFSKCGGRSKGRAQVIELAAYQNINVGDVTIRCDQAIANEYLHKKISGSLDPYLLSFSRASEVNHSQFTGFFFDHEVDDSTAIDSFEIDFRDFDVQANDKLNLVILSGSIASMMDLEVSVQRSDEVSATIYTTSSDSVTLAKQLDLMIQHDLSSSASDNLFTVKINAKSVSASEKNEILGTSSVLENEKKIYLLSTYISNNDEVVNSFSSAHYLEENTYCAEGEGSYSVRATRSDTQSSDSGDSSADQASCATVDMNSDGPGGGGMMSMLLGVFICAFFSLIQRSKFLNN